MVSRRGLLRLFGAAVGSTPLLAACDGSRPFAPARRPVARIASAPGVAAGTITLGSIYPLTGPAAGYASVVQTMDAYFKKVNDDGGINGRTVRFLVEDDQYSPVNTLPLAKKLMEQDQVFALVGDLGTTTTSAIADYTTSRRTPLLFVVSGSDVWGDVSKYPYAVGLQVPYPAEGRALGRYITGAWPGNKVGLLYQNDDFGREYLACKETLGANNPFVGEETYDAPARDLSQQVKNLRAKGAQVVILIATAKPAGLALKAAADLGWKPNIVMSSVAEDGSVFGLAGGTANVEGVISDTWQRSYDDGSPEVQAVKDLLAKYAPQVQFAQSPVTGYIVALLVVESLRRAGPNPTRESLMGAAESFRNFAVPQLLPGSVVSTSKTDHSPVKSLQLTRATNGRFVPFGSLVS
ncbi:MAG TPA: ABC transporter substrate-binding protein [Dehalococcoidia bacterium]|nr:ABC transporter substrate-binding protein [Dehalococcoidia bacterium]